MGYVYKITNTVNQKSYIGISIREPEKDRIKDHLSGNGNRIIARSVKKYGKNVFTYEILEANVFDEFLPDLEVAYIANYNTIAPHGYNLTSGGDNHKKLSEETRKKISEARKGKTFSVETRKKISEANKGKKHTAKTRQKMSETRKGQPCTDETRQKISQAKKGSTRTTEHLRKLSEKRKGSTLSAQTRRKISNTLKGSTLSEETRKKISEARKGQNLHPDHISARNYFFSLPSDMLLKEKRKRLFHKFPNISKRVIYRWVRKWNA